MYNVILNMFILLVSQVLSSTWFSFLGKGGGKQD